MRFWKYPDGSATGGLSEAYTAWHDKGLEILGIFCGGGTRDLDQYFATTSKTPWPQLVLRDTKPRKTLDDFGAQDFPKTFFIDRVGIVRLPADQLQFEKLIPKLIEEK